MSNIATKDKIIENIINDPYMIFNQMEQFSSNKPSSGPFSTKEKSLTMNSATTLEYY